MARHSHVRWPVSLEKVLSCLPEARPVRGTETAWQSPCPAHQDTHPSLSIGVGFGGRVLLHCHGGCSTEAVVESLGLTLADLMGPPADDRRDRIASGGGSASLFAVKGTKGRKGRKEKTVRPLRPLTSRTDRDDAQETPMHPPTPAVSSSPTVYATVDQAVAALAAQLGSYTDLYSYQDRDGTAVGAVVRWDGPDGKTIRPVSRRADGWVLGGMERPRPLYRLTEVADRPTERVYIVEGEKAAEAGRQLGVLTTTSAHGSGAAEQTDWEPLAGRQVVILSDNDEPGRKYAHAVATLVGRLSPPAEVRLLDLPGLEPRGDLHDWVEAHDAVETETLRRRLDELVETASYAAPKSDSHRPASSHDGQECQAVLCCLADVEPVEVRWLWPGRIALGRITVLVGRPGEGKSFLTTEIAARVTTGRPWPDGSEGADGSVILICAEDDPGDTIRPRLDAHGADVRRIHLLRMVRRTEADGRQREGLFTLEDVAALEAVLRDHRDCRLVVVDPIGSFLGGRADAHRDNDVRSVLAPVAALAEAHDAAMLVVAHRRKSPGTHADDLTLGSRAFTGIARAVWHLSRDSQDKDRRLLLPGKNNLAAEGSGLAFTIGGAPPAIAWESDPVAMTADEALAEAADDGMSVRREAQDWLREALAAGPVAAGEIVERAEAEGITVGTLKRAKKHLKVVSSKRHIDGRTVWFWQMPTG